jgi:hypothetical protein
MVFSGTILGGWKSFKVYRIWQKGPSPYYNPLFTLYFDPHKK